MMMNAAMRKVLGVGRWFTVVSALLSSSAYADGLADGIVIKPHLSKLSYQSGEPVRLRIECVNESKVGIRVSEGDKFIWSVIGSRETHERYRDQTYLAQGEIPLNGRFFGPLFMPPNSSRIFEVIRIPIPSRATPVVLTDLPEGTYVYEIGLVPASFPSYDPNSGYMVTSFSSLMFEVEGEERDTPKTAATPETPWKSNAYGIEGFTGLGGYNVGYQFVPQVNGKVTKLGILIKGVGTVRLYDGTGSILTIGDAITNVGAWHYATIPQPIAVTAGQTYTVAIYLRRGGMASVRTLSADPLPKTFGHVKILKSVWGTSEAMPRNGVVNYMYGGVDIEFVPNQ